MYVGMSKFCRCASSRPKDLRNWDNSCSQDEGSTKGSSGLGCETCAGRGPGRAQGSAPLKGWFRCRVVQLVYSALLLLLYDQLFGQRHFWGSVSGVGWGGALRLKKYAGWYFLM